MARPLAAFAAAMWYLRRERVRSTLRGTCIILLLILTGMNLRHGADWPENNGSNTWDTPHRQWRGVHKVQDNFSPTFFTMSCEYLTRDEFRQQQTARNIHVDLEDHAQMPAPTSVFHVGVQQPLVLPQFGDASGLFGINVTTVTGFDRGMLQSVPSIDMCRLGRVDMLAQHALFCVADLADPPNFYTLSEFDILLSSNDQYGVRMYVERRCHFRLHLSGGDLMRMNDELLKFIYHTWVTRAARFFKSTWHRPWHDSVAFLLNFLRWVKGRWMYSCLLVDQPSCGSDLPAVCRVVASVVSCMRPPSHWHCSVTQHHSIYHLYYHLSQLYFCLTLYYFCLTLTTKLQRMILTHQRGSVVSAPKTAGGAPLSGVLTKERSGRRRLSGHCTCPCVCGGVLVCVRARPLF